MSHRAIEKNIFFYWEGPEMPSGYTANVKYVKETHIDHDVTVVDSSYAREILTEHTPKLDAIFDDINIPAVKSDIMRMAILYKHGGWYVDCDSRPRPEVTFWDADDAELVLNWVCTNKVISIQNSFIGGRSGHPFFIRALKIMERVITTKATHYSVYKSSGPDLCLIAATPFLRQPGTYYRELDYRYMNVITGNTKGSWSFQENCGIWSNDQNPVLIKTDVPIDRIESLQAFAYFKRMFDKHPETRQENYRKLMIRAGAHYVMRHKNGSEIAELFFEYVPKSEAIAYKGLMTKLSEIKDIDTLNQVRKFVDR